jgi:hypothetical protein
MEIQRRRRYRGDGEQLVPGGIERVQTRGHHLGAQRGRRVVVRCGGHDAHAVRLE